MPNVPLAEQTLFVPLYAGLSTEVVDKLVQPQNGVLEMENMVCALTGEISKRDGSANLATPTTPVFPAGTALPTLYELAGYRDELVRLSVVGPNPLWPWLPSEGAWMNPGAATSTVTSMFRGPIATSLTGLVDSVTVGASVQTPDVARVSPFALEAHEQWNYVTNSSVGVVQAVVDLASSKPVVVTERPQSFRPKCVSIGPYMLCFSLDLFDGTVRVDLYDTTVPSSINALTYILTSSAAINTASLLEVTAKNGTTATAAYTDTTGTVQAIDFVPSTAVITLYALHTSSDATFTATSAMAWVQDFGASGKLSLVTQDTTNGVVTHWGFRAISGSVSTAVADYVVDSSIIGTSLASAIAAGVWGLAAYTTSASSTGEFVVMYDVLATGDTASSVVYRATRVGSTVNAGMAYWFGASLVTKFYQPGDGGTYIVTAFSNSANPTTPQNTYFVCVDGTPQPVPQATIAPQGAGGAQRRSSSLSSVVPNPSPSTALTVVTSFVDEQFVSGIAVQLTGVEMLQIRSLNQQDTTTSPPVEAFGCLLVPGGTLMAYDGRTYGEAVFANRPEPPKLIATNPPSPAPVTITHSSSDRLIGQPVQGLAANPGDLVSTPSAGYTLPHTSSDAVTIGGGQATYTFHNAGNFTIISGARILVGGTLAVSGSGTAGNNVTGTITAVTQSGLNNQVIAISMSATTQSAAALGGGTVAVATSLHPNRVYLRAPGVPIVTNDPTFASQLFVIQDRDSPTDPMIGTFTLDASTPCGTETLPGGFVYFFFQVTGSPAVVPWQWEQVTPIVSLQLANPLTAMTWTLANASFDQTYVGGTLTTANELNPGNAGTFTILSVPSPTSVVTTGPANGGFAGSNILRNEDLGVTTAITYVVTPTFAIPVGAHAYVALYSRLDANGRRWTSPPSLPATVATSASFPTVTALVQCLNFTGQSCNIELYRSQTGVGGQYNRVQSLSNNPLGQAVSFSDNAADTQIALQQELFSDGGILPGTPLPGVSLIGVHQGRVFVASPEAPQSLFYSNPDDSGSGGGGDGLLFDTTNLSLDIIDNHGPLNAIQSMDSTLVAIKGDSVYAISGTGPDGSGQNGAYQAQRIAAGVGTSNPRSVVLEVGTGTAPGGVWFDSEATRAGLHTVTRGLTVEYTGGGVRRYTEESIVASLVYPSLTQVRWYTASGRTLIYDWTSKLWDTNAGQPCLSAVLYNGLPAVAPSDTFTGYVLQETPGLYEDGELAGVYTPYAQKVASAWLSVGGLKGYQRTKRLQGVGKVVGSHTLTAKLYANYDDTNLIGTFTKTFTAGDTWDWELLPSVQKVDAIKVVLLGTDLVGALAGTAGFSVTGVTLLIGVKRGLSKLPDTSRMTGS